VAGIGGLPELQGRDGKREAMTRTEQQKADAARKFRALRASGHTGPIDHNGDAVTDLDAWIDQHRPPQSGEKR
jgi:hypothetical protein